MCVGVFGFVWSVCGFLRRGLSEFWVLCVVFCGVGYLECVFFVSKGVGVVFVVLVLFGVFSFV